MMEKEMKQLEEIIAEINVAESEAQASIAAGAQPFADELDLFAGVTSVIMAARPSELVRYAMTGSFSQEIAAHVAVMMFRLGRKYATVEFETLSRMVE